MNAEQRRRAGDFTGAIDLCRDALARFPEHLSARVTLGLALMDLGRAAEARSEFEAVRRLAPDNMAALRGLAQLHGQFDSYDDLHVEPDLSAPDPADPVVEVHVAEVREVHVAEADVAEPAPVVRNLECWLEVVEDAGVRRARHDRYVRNLECWLEVVEARRTVLTECSASD